MLYCDVYPLRTHGRTLSREDARAARVSGWLRVWRPQLGPPIHFATVVDEDGREPITGLSHVSLRRIERGGILLRGFLDEGRSEPPVPQSWWCVPQPDPARAPRAAATAHAAGAAPCGGAHGQR